MIIQLKFMLIWAEYHHNLGRSPKLWWYFVETQRKHTQTANAPQISRATPLIFVRVALDLVQGRSPWTRFSLMFCSKISSTTRATPLLLMIFHWHQWISHCPSPSRGGAVWYSSFKKQEIAINSGPWPEFMAGISVFQGLRPWNTLGLGQGLRPWPSFGRFP